MGNSARKQSIFTRSASVSPAARKEPIIQPPPTGSGNQNPHSFTQSLSIRASKGKQNIQVLESLPSRRNHAVNKYTSPPHRTPTIPHPGNDLIRPHPVNSRIVVGLYNYIALEKTDVSFKKDERMEIIDDNGEWWKVKHLGTNKIGLIPWNFVAEELSVDSEEWFFGQITRKEADKLLLLAENPRGTFLVRPSEHNPRGYSLSVKDGDKNRGFHVKHYKINPLDNGGFYISTNLTYLSLKELVKAYKSESLGLCHVLSKPCPNKPKPQVWDLSPQMRDHWEIDRTDIRLMKKLGRGNFGEVWYGKWKEHTEVAVKTLREGTMSAEAFLDEATIMKTFRHKNLVALYAVCSTEEPIYIVQEYMCNGSLLEFLRSKDGRKLIFEDLTHIAYQIASGMEYLESKSLIHRDLAARNVLIGQNKVAKICDFGLARVIEDDNYCTKGSKFPVKWTAPEAILYGTFSIKSDVWSYGVLLMELFTYGQVPYPGMSAPDTVVQVQRGYRMPKPNNPDVSDDMYRTILECWKDVPDRRPTFEFLAHYFEGFIVASEVPYKEAEVTSDSA